MGLSFFFFKDLSMPLDFKLIFYFRLRLVKFYGKMCVLWAFGGVV